MRVHLLAWLLAVPALAATPPDAEPVAATPEPSSKDLGWSHGIVAEGAQKVLEGASHFPVLPFPKEVVDRVHGPTVLFYFSPTCPHCRKVAKEVEALHERLKGEGATVLGIASGTADPADVQEFRSTFGVTFEILQDTSGEIVTAMAAKSTPSVMLVVPPAPGARPDTAPTAGKGSKAVTSSLEVRDLWYPYLPSWDVLVEGRVLGDLWKAFRPGEYQGTNACGACHLQEHASWLLTHHSVAWHTLEDQGRTEDDACTGCHVTGKGQPTGWGSGVPTQLTDVGCEACHGPGGPHDGERTDPRTTCTGCHDAQHSIAFSVEKGLPHLDHFLAGHLSDAEQEERQQALWKGEAPRDLLAFPEGRNVGSAKCRACHPAEYDQWADSPHANAMSLLRDQGHDDPSCVRCHATSHTSGPAAQTLADFDTFGGVGCESCHGPGERHVAEGGGKTNIVGLGESCPTCVVEAVCTSCHTPKWSPSFAFEPSLDKVKHAQRIATP